MYNHRLRRVLMLDNNLLRGCWVAHLNGRDSDLLRIRLPLNDNIIVICCRYWLLLDRQLMRLLHVVGLSLHLRVGVCNRLLHLRADRWRSVAPVGFGIVHILATRSKRDLFIDYSY